MPGKKVGTIRGKKTTPAQQRLMGAARGMQEGTTPISYSSAAAKIAQDIPARDLHRIAKKPKGGFRKRRAG